MRNAYDRYTLDTGPYAEEVRKARERAERALSNYDGPVIPLEELRDRTAKELQGASLTEIVIRDRNAGW